MLLAGTLSSSPFFTPHPQEKKETNTRMALSAAATLRPAALTRAGRTANVVAPRVARRAVAARAEPRDQVREFGGYSTLIKSLLLSSKGRRRKKKARPSPPSSLLSPRGPPAPGLGAPMVRSAQPCRRSRLRATRWEIPARGARPPRRGGGRAKEGLTVLSLLAPGLFESL